MRRMRLKSIAWLCLALYLTPTYATAQAVGCNLSVEQGGDLGASVDGLTLGSEEDGGREARLRVQTTFNNTITIDPPALVLSPAGFDDSGQQLEVAYSGDGELAGAVQDYTTNSTAFQTGAVTNDTVTINARAITENGVVEGTYRLRVVVTCS